MSCPDAYLELASGYVEMLPPVAVSASIHKYCQGGTDIKQWDDVTVVLGMVGLDGYNMHRRDNIHNAADALLGAEYHHDLRYEAPTLAHWHLI